VRVRADVRAPRFGFGPNVRRDSIGIITHVSGETCHVDFPRRHGWRGAVAEMERVSLAVGDRVRVRADVRRPRYDWGSGVTHESIGTIDRINDASCHVNFPNHHGWHGVLDEMERVEPQAQPGAHRSIMDDDDVLRLLHEDEDFFWERVGAPERAPTPPPPVQRRHSMRRSMPAGAAGTAGGSGLDDGGLECLERVVAMGFETEAALRALRRTERHGRGPRRVHAALDILVASGHGAGPPLEGDLVVPPPAYRSL